MWVATVCRARSMIMCIRDSVSGSSSGGMAGASRRRSTSRRHTSWPMATSRVPTAPAKSSASASMSGSAPHPSGWGRSMAELEGPHHLDGQGRLRVGRRVGVPPAQLLPVGGHRLGLGPQHARWRSRGETTPVCPGRARASVRPGRSPAIDGLDAAQAGRPARVGEHAPRARRRCARGRTGSRSAASPSGSSCSTTTLSTTVATRELGPGLGDRRRLDHLGAVHLEGDAHQATQLRIAVHQEDPGARCGRHAQCRLQSPCAR